MNKLINRVFCRWSEWTLHTSNKPYIEETSNPIFGVSKHNVICDIYESTNKYTGMKRYKTVKKL